MVIVDQLSNKEVNQSLSGHQQPLKSFENVKLPIQSEAIFIREIQGVKTLGDVYSRNILRS